MTAQETRDYAAHMVQLAMHAGHSLVDVKRGTMRQYQPLVAQMTEAARSFYRAAQQFEQAVTALAEKDGDDAASSV